MTSLNKFSFDFNTNKSLLHGDVPLDLLDIIPKLTALLFKCQIMTCLGLGPDLRLHSQELGLTCDLLNND